MPVPVSVRPGVAERLFYLISPQSLSAGVAVAGLLVLARSVRLVSAAGRGGAAERRDPPQGRPTAPLPARSPVALLPMEGRPLPAPPALRCCGSRARFPVPPRLRCAVTRSRSGRRGRWLLLYSLSPRFCIFFKVFLTYRLVLLVPALQFCLPVAPPRVQPGNDFSRGCASVDAELIPLSFSTPLRAEQLL